MFAPGNNPSEAEETTSLCSETTAGVSELTSSPSPPPATSRVAGARHAQTPKRSQAESARWSQRAGRASTAAFHEPSPFRSSKWIAGGLQRSNLRPQAPDDGRMACQIDAAPPHDAPSWQALEWRRRRPTSSPNRTGPEKNRPLF